MPPRRVRIIDSGTAGATSQAAARRARAAATKATAFTARTAQILRGGGTRAREWMSKLSDKAYNELVGWAKHRRANVWYMFMNFVQFATCLVILVLGKLTVQEARTDLNANVARKLMDSSDRVAVTPCGFPGPDLLHLLRLQGVYEHEFGLPQLIEPDYRRWNARVQGSLCSTDPFWASAFGMGTGNDGDLDADTDNSRAARMLHGLATIMGRRDLEPTEDADNSTLLDVAEVDMLDDLCDRKGKRTYSKRLEAAFGDPLTRIARAYLAAAPAFRAYAKSRGASGHTGASCLGAHDPFAYTKLTDTEYVGLCGNADYAHHVLERAGSIDNSARLAGAVAHAQASPSVATSPLEMLYALYALSVVNHIDKTANGGACFRNTHSRTAAQFCEQLYAEPPGETLFQDYTLPDVSAQGATTRDIFFYRHGDAPLASEYRCTALTVDGKTLASSRLPTGSPAPSPPPFVSFRGANATWATSRVKANDGANDAEQVRLHVIGSCAATMQYGLYDQERLFGVPDVLQPFQHDNRPDAKFHVLGKITAKRYFTDPLESVDAFARPTERLELYLAYRLAALTLWGTMMAAVTGFFMGRAGVPFAAALIALVLNLKGRGGRSITIVQPPERSIAQGGLTLLAVLVGLFVGFYTLFVDPSAQSYYPTTPKCTDFLPKDYAHSSGGAYVTSWGKRRFDRYSETQLGITVIVVSLIPAVYSSTKVFLQSRANSQYLGMTALSASINAVLLVAAVTIIGAQVYNCISTGDLWLDAARVSPYDTTTLNDRLGRDCLAQLLVTFWATLALSVSRASWTVEPFDWFLWRFAFYGGCVFLAWLNQLSYVALMSDEYEDAFSNPSKDTNRRNAQVLSLGGTILFTAAVVVDFWSVESARRAGRRVDPINNAKNMVLDNHTDTGPTTCATGASFPFLDRHRFEMPRATTSAPFVFGAQDAKRGRYATVPSLSRLGR